MPSVAAGHRRPHRRPPGKGPGAAPRILDLLKEYGINAKMKKRPRTGVHSDGHRY